MEPLKFGDTVYLSLKRSAVVLENKVCMKDLGEIYCERKDIQHQIQNLPVQMIKDKETKVLSATYIIEQIQKAYPGKIILSIGENDIIISKRRNKNPWIEALKVIFVSLVLFFGTAFTIIFFHIDVEIEMVFENLYHQMTGQVSDGVTALEISYTLGIAVGILLFFNHMSGKKVTPEPTPIQVQMRDYESKMDQAFIQNVTRKGSEKDAK